MYTEPRLYGLVLVVVSGIHQRYRSIETVELMGF